VILEKSKQSLESQLQMVHPRRSEVERVPLTDEEKEFLSKIMDKAVAAEKAGELKKALDLYTDYKNELLKIKETKQQEEQKPNVDEAKQKLIHWAMSFLFGDAKKWVEENFKVLNTGSIVCKADLNFPERIIRSLPENLIIQGNLNLSGTQIKELPDGLCVWGDCNIVETEIKDLPDDLEINGTLIIDEDGPESLLNKAQELFDRRNVVNIEKKKRLIKR